MLQSKRVGNPFGCTVFTKIQSFLTLSSPRSSHKLSKCSFSTSAAHRTDFAHAVIGAGVVGLAIARQLSARGEPTILIEKHASVGTETSSRNSEVIHAGLYYGRDSLKTKLCLRGKSLLYALCEKEGIPFRRTGKWIIAQDETQMGELERLHQHAKEVGVPTRFLSRDEIGRREPDVRAEAGVLESESTGIVDSHALMTYLEGAFADAGGDLAFNTTVKSIKPLADSNSSSRPGSAGWEITTTSTDIGNEQTEPTTITAANLINSAGLHAIPLSNSILSSTLGPTSPRILISHYAKGTYYSYSHSHPRPPSTLLYPAPVPGLAGLGTHLTLDMAGQIRFGPDVEWLSPSYPASANDLAPNPDPTRVHEAVKAIRTYYPGILEEAINVDYCGIRPKLAGKDAGGSFRGDFYVRKEEGFEGWVNLLGIESPGLTSSLAIGEMVEALLYR